MQSFRIIGPSVLEKKILKVITNYGLGGHLGIVNHQNKLMFPLPKGFDLALIGQAVSKEKMFEIVDDDCHDHHDNGRRSMGIL